MDRIDAEKCTANWIAKINEGDTIAAKGLLIWISVCLRKELDMGETLRLFLAEALEQIADGAPCDKALGLNQGQGNFTARHSARDIEIACRIRDLIGEGKGKHKARGGAYSIVAAEFEISATRAQQIWDKWKKEIYSDFYRE